jgi:hypothetical protein
VVCDCTESTRKNWQAMSRKVRSRTPGFVSTYLISKYYPRTVLEIVLILIPCILVGADGIIILTPA